MGLGSSVGTLADSFFSQNSGANGGAISINGAMNNVLRTTFSENTASLLVGNGGAVDVVDGGTLGLIADSTFDNNDATNGGALAIRSITASSTVSSKKLNFFRKYRRS